MACQMWRELAAINGEEVECAVATSLGAKICEDKSGAGPFMIDATVTTLLPLVMKRCLGPDMN